MSAIPLAANSQRRVESDPVVSVIIPAYNHADFLGETIGSVLAQTYGRYEIIVVDDGSTDRTPEVVGQFRQVRYLVQPNRGQASARNRGLQRSRGDYVVFLDADDHLLPEHFATSLEAFRARPDAGWVCGNFRLLGPDHTWRHVHHCEALPDYFGSLLRINFIGSIHAIMFRREILIAAGGFDERLKACEDHELFLRLARRWPLYCHHRLVAEYRRKEQQLSKQWDVMLKWEMQVIRAQRRHIRGHPAYEAAYREGLARCRSRYGERALWQMVEQLRARRWVRAFAMLRVLVRCYPQGLAALVQGKLSRLWPCLRRQNS